MGKRYLFGAVLFLSSFLVFHSVGFAATFYSRASGNWTSTTTWSTVGCGGAAATTLPTVSDDVVICAGHTVTTNFTANKPINNLTINTSGVLTMGTNRHIQCRNLVLNGTINGGSNGQVRFAGTAGNTFSGTGTVAVTSASSGLRLRNNATVLPGTDITFSNSSRFDLAKRTLTNNGTIRMTGTSTLLGNATTNGVFNNATSTSFLYYNTPSNFPTTVRLTATGTGNTVVFGATSGGPFTMDGQGSYHNLIIQGAATKRLNPTNINIAGLLTIASGSTLDANGSKVISLQGNWDNDNGGTFTKSSSTVIFNSSTANQTIYTPGAGENFYALTINNTFSGGTVTANGSITLTAAATLQITSGIFVTGTNTLGQTGAANFIMSGGELRMAKLSTTLPELTGTYNITGGTITFDGAGSQTIRSLSAFPAQYYHVNLSGSGTKTLAGNIWVNGNWVNNGVALSGNFTVTFGGVDDQTITKTTGENFYALTVNKSNTLILAAGTDLTVTSGLTMTAGDINLNARTLTLGSGAGASLTRTAGKVYGGSWKRFFPASAITSSSGSFYGLFPIGTALEYRPVEINTTVSPTTAGYVTATHTDGTTTTDVSYIDNEGATIQRITAMRTTLATQTLAGGAYNLNVTFTSLSSAGALSDLKLETLTGSPQGVGVSVATSGSTSSPTGKRTLLNVTQLNNDFVLGTTNKSTTPMKSTYYSRKSGNWNDASAGNGTWALVDGGSSCDCVPPSSSDAVINNGHTVTIAAASTADYIIVRSGGNLVGTNTLIVNFDVTVEGTGKVAPTAGSWSVGRNLNLTGTTLSSSGASTTINGDFVLNPANSLTLAAPLTVSGNATLNGTLDVGASTLTFNGASKTISGTATINGSGTVTITGNKSTTALSNITIVPGLTISAGTTFVNNGTITLLGTATGLHATTSIWTNAASSTLNIQGAGFLATGVLNANASNLVTYSGNGSQAIKAPASGYYNLTVSNAGTKTLSGATAVSNQLTIQGAAILDAATNGLTGTANLSMTGTSQLQLGNTATGTYPALSGTYSLDGGTVVLKQSPGASTAYTIRGVDYYNLTLNGAGAANYTFGTSASIANDLNVSFGGTSTFANPNGGLSVGNSFTFNATSSATTTLSSELLVGSFTLSGGAIADGGNVIEITEAGGWIRNGGTYTSSGAGRAYFTGDVEQSIGGSMPTSFRRIEMENTSLTGVRLNQPTTVTTQLLLTAGKIISNSSNYLLLSASASSDPGSEDSFVEGPMRKTGSADFVFPVGKGSVWARIGISGLSASLTFQAEYFNGGYGAYDVSQAIPQNMHHVSSLEYWQLDRVSASGSASVTLYWENSDVSEIKNCGDLVVAKGNASSEWENAASIGTSGSCGPGGAGSVTSQSLSTFSPFTFGAIQQDLNPLPIKLLRFTATPAKSKIDLLWITAQEKNNDRFTLERSGDGISYEILEEQAGAGNSDRVLTYEAEDTNPLKGINYYRLKQTDYDGKFEYFGPVAASVNAVKTIDVFPNPTSDVIRWQCPEKVISVKVFDNSGKLMFTNALRDGDAPELNLSNLPDGMYQIQFFSLAKIYNAKVTKN
jgi:hypothetical protein